MYPRFLALSKRTYDENRESCRIKIIHFSYAKFEVPLRYLCENTK